MQGKGIAGHQLCTLTAHALLSTKWYLYVIVTDCSQTTLRLCTAVMERWLDSIKSQVKILRLSFLGQHPFSAEDEVMAEEKGESPSFEISKNGLAYTEGKSCAGQRLRGLHDPNQSLTCTVTDVSHCFFRKGLEFLPLQCITCPLKDLQNSNYRKGMEYIEEGLI